MSQGQIEYRYCQNKKQKNFHLQSSEATIGWEFPEYNVTESDGAVEICAVGNIALSATIPLINVQLSDGSKKNTSLGVS